MRRTAARCLVIVCAVIVWLALPCHGQPGQALPAALYALEEPVLFLDELEGVVGPVVPVGEPHPLPPSAGFRKPVLDFSHLVTDRLPEGVQATSLATWDWRKEGIVTAVHDQGGCGACYAFASLASLESRILIDGGAAVDLSENNLKECDYYELNNIYDNGEPWASCDGANVWLTANHLSQYGAVLESCDPYVDADVACRTTCPPVKTLLGMRNISGGSVPHPDVLKAALLRYGPLSVNMFTGNNDAWAREFSSYDGSYVLHYDGTEETNHLVLLVGYDDNLAHAGGRGAWIAKNSWGTDWGGPCGYGSTRGYFYIAYGSARFGEYAAAFQEWQGAAPDCQLLYYDQAGANRRFGFPGKTHAWGLAQYRAPVTGFVSRIEWWCHDATVDVDLYLYSSFDGQNLRSLLWQKENLSYPEAGYFSVAVNPPVPVPYGQAIVTVMRIQTLSLTLPLAVDILGPAGPGCTYMSESATNGSWIDIGAVYQRDAGLRVRVCPQVQPSPTRTRTATPSPTATRTPTRTPTVKPVTPRARAYLPVIPRNYVPPEPGIFGRLLRAGAPAPGLVLNLWMGDERTFWNLVGTATTGSDGRYLFRNVPTLDAGLVYMVNYRNTEDTPNPGPGYLFYWGGNRIATYRAGERTFGGDFDMVDLALVSPAYGAAVNLPAQFCWQERPVVADVYDLVIEVPSTGAYGVWTAPAGSTCVTIHALPAGLAPGGTFRWSIYVKLPGRVPYNYGVSYTNRMVTLRANAADSDEPQVDATIRVALTLVVAAFVVLPPLPTAAKRAGAARRAGWRGASG